MATPLHEISLTHDICIAAIGLRPRFLKNGDPYLMTIGLTKNRLALGIDRHEVVNHYLPNNASNPQGHPIDGIARPRLIPEDGSDPLFPLSQRRHRRKEVAIAQGALDDVLRLDSAIEEHRCGNDTAESSPVSCPHALNGAQTAVIMRELLILPELGRGTVLSNQLLVIGFLDLEDLGGRSEGTLRLRREGRDGRTVQLVI